MVTVLVNSNVQFQEKGSILRGSTTLIGVFGPQAVVWLLTIWLSRRLRELGRLELPKKWRPRNIACDVVCHPPKIY